MNNNDHELVTIAQMVAERREIAEIIDELKADYEKRVGEYKHQLTQIEEKIVTAMDREGLKSVRTPDGTAYFSHLEKYKVVDRENFFSWVLDNKAVDVLTTHLAADAIRERGIIPAGVEVDYIRQLRIRKSI